MPKYIPPTVVEEVYTLGDLVLKSRQARGSYRTTWRIVCQTCGDNLLVQKITTKHWVARCHKCKVEYSIAPAEYYIMKHADFRRIMGDL